MWLYRGVQSAVFYYATCTPCASSVDRRKRMKDAARSKRENEKLDAIVTDQPRPFAQPTAFSTNRGWMEEIALGPGPPARRGGNRSAHRRINSGETDALSAKSKSRQNLEEPEDPAQKKDNKGSLMQPLEDRWNRMLYQREDEPLWGEAEVKGSSVGISGGGRNDTKEPSKYYIARVPPVNDLHPPIVSGPRSRAETRWMLQPPPSAKVMAGKVRITPSMGASPPMGASQANRDKNVSPSAERNYQLPSLSTQNTPKKTLDPSPTLKSIDEHDVQKTSESKNSGQSTPQPSPYASAYGHDESNLVITTTHSRTNSSMLSSLGDSDGESPRNSLHSPQTPTSRPGSKEANSGKHMYPSMSRNMSAMPRDNKVELLHLEINDAHDDVGLGQLEHHRPWRWSMDV